MRRHRHAGPPAPPFKALYQHTPEASKGNAFCWDTGRPSIFMADRTFKPTESGDSLSQTASRAVQEFEQSNGRNPGTLYGLSAKSDKAAEEFQHRIAKKRTASHYRRAA